MRGQRPEFYVLIPAHIQRVSFFHGGGERISFNISVNSPDRKNRAELRVAGHSMTSFAVL